MGTNYYDTFITVAADCPAITGEVPDKLDSIAGIEYQLLSGHPYQMTSDELLFEVHALRKGLITGKQLAEAHAAFFTRPHACLRCSPLAKRYGWGLHHDADGKVSIYAVDSPDYRRFMTDQTLTIVPAMRNRRS